MSKKYLKYLIEKFEQEPSPIINSYGTGGSSNIVDNQRLYDVVKIVKSFLDKHLYPNNFYYDMVVDGDKIVIKFMEKNEQEDSISVKTKMWTSYVLEDIIKSVENILGGIYDNFKVEKDVKIDGDIKHIKIIIKILDLFPESKYGDGIRVG